MKIVIMFHLIFWGSLLVLLPLTLISTNGQESSFLIDDFSREDRRSALDTEWRSFSDRVMGGVSLGQHRFQEIGGKRCIHLTGEVSLKNNGGFIQVALPLSDRGRSLDASAYTGIRIQARGNNTRYFLHLRTSRTRLPWQYYGAEFRVTEEWSTIEIPFADFKPESLKAALDPARLRRIAIVAAWEEFAADVAVARIEFYR